MDGASLELEPDQGHHLTIALSILGVLVAPFLLWVAVAVEGPEPALRATLAGVALVGLASGWWAAALVRRSRVGALEVRPDAVVLRHGLALRGEQHLPRAALVAFAIDPDARPGAALPIPHRFRWLSPLRGPDGGVMGHLWDGRRGLAQLMPLGSRRQTPNVALLLTTPMVLEQARRHTPTGTQFAGASVDRRTPVGGLLLRARDPDAVGRALAAWPELTPEIDGHMVYRHDLNRTCAQTIDGPSTPIRPRLLLAGVACELGVPVVLLLLGLALVLVRAVDVLGWPALLSVGLSLLPFAGSIASAAWPRPWTPTGGMTLGPDLAPALHALVADVADILRLPRPAGVEVGHEPRTWLSRCGTGKAWVGIGLPLLAALDRDELRALVAHQLTHIRRDASRFPRLAVPLLRSITRTRDAIARRRRHTVLGVLLGPALAAGIERLQRRAIRRTFELLQHEEAIADAAAARVPNAGLAGTRARIDRLQAATDAWWHRMAAELEAGTRPPLLDALAAALAPRPAHRPLWMSAPQVPAPAPGLHHELLADVDAVERALLVHLAGEERVAALRPADPDRREGSAPDRPLWRG